MTDQPRVRVVCRSSISGKFVSREFAKANPDTTQCSEWRRYEVKGE